MVKKLTSILSFITVLVTVLLIIFQLVMIYNGVYFLGDTVSYLEISSWGKLLTTFILHNSLWPPLFTLWVNLLDLLFSPPTFALISTLIFFTSSLFFTILLFKEIGLPKKVNLVMSTIVLLSGPLAILMSSFMSEPLLVSLTLVASFFTIKFWKTSQEKWLIGWLIASALVPLSRYLGVSFVIWSSLILLFKVLHDWKKNKQVTYSRLLVLLSLMVAWVPLAFFLLKNKVAEGLFLGLRDANTIYSLSELFFQYLTAVWSDLGYFLLVVFVVGFATQLIVKMHHHFSLLFLSGNAIFYTLFLLIGQIKYYVDPHLPSRYISISYPFIIMTFFLLGSLLRRLLDKQNKLSSNFILYELFFTQLALIFILLFMLFTSFNRFIYEQKGPTSAVLGVYNTHDLKQICASNPSLLIHPHSRNWILKSTLFLCQEKLQVISNNTVIAKDQKILSGYQLDNENLEEYSYFDADGYDFYTYMVNGETFLDVEDVFSKRTTYE